MTRRVTDVPGTLVAEVPVRKGILMIDHDLTGVLAASHEAARHAVLRLNAPAAASIRRPLKDQLTNLLGGHLAAVEAVLLPPMQSRGWPGVRARTLTALFDLKASVAQLVVADVGDEACDRILADVVRRLEMERQLEVSELLPAMHQALGDEECRSLLPDIELCLLRASGEAVPDATVLVEPSVLRTSVDEARVVLSSIPTPDEPAA
jgi:hypothetical protein